MCMTEPILHQSDSITINLSLKDLNNCKKALQINDQNFNHRSAHGWICAEESFEWNNVRALIGVIHFEY